MKIVSLIPSATEIVFALGLGDSLEGVTFECDYPPEAAVEGGRVRHRAARPTSRCTAHGDRRRGERDGRRRRGHLHARRRAHPRRSNPISSSPRTCAGCVRCRRARSRRHSTCSAVVPRSISLDPIDARRGHRLHRGGRRRHRHRAASAARSMHELRARVDVVRGAVAQRPSTAHVRAGVVGPAVQRRPLGARHDRGRGRRCRCWRRAGERSRRLEWDEVDAADPDVAVFMPCGYTLDAGGRRRPPRSSTCPRWRRRARRTPTDANALFSRPGPRLRRRGRSPRVGAAPAHLPRHAPGSSRRSGSDPTRQGLVARRMTQAPLGVLPDAGGEDDDHGDRRATTR